MTIIATQAFRIAGTLISPGATPLNYSADIEADLVRRGVATYSGDNPETGDAVQAQWNPTGTALVDPVTGANILRGEMTDGVWMTIPSIFRLRLTGTGTVALDSKDALGNITTGVAIYTVSGATDQIEFPYAGDNAVAIRATLTGTTTAEVI